MLNIRTKHFTIRLSALLIIATAGFIFILAEAFRAPDLKTQIDTARAALALTRQSQTIDFNADDITADPYDTDEPTARKVLFLVKMLPLVVAENDRILAQRDAARRTSSPAQLNALALAHGLKPAPNVNKDALLKRIDIVPPSLVLAQAAIESAWGTSRFAREGNAFFGERTYDPDTPGITPKRASGFKVKSFVSPQGSIRSYMRTLNTHRAYQALRDRREALRALDQPLSGQALTSHLKAYSELGGDYISMIEDTIAANRLDDFDALIAQTKSWGK